MNAKSILQNKTLGFLGAGNMAEALARGVIQSGLIPAQNVLASDVSDARRTVFETQLKTGVTTDNKAVTEFSDILLLCVKPQQANTVLAEIAPVFKSERHVLASICAGVTETIVSPLFSASLLLYTLGCPSLFCELPTFSSNSILAAGGCA